MDERSAMPTTYTHYFHGQQVYDHIKKHCYFDPKYIDLFNIGVHGPDIVFYYHFYNPHDKNKVGYKMHHVFGDQLFAQFKQIYLTSENKDATLAYLCGFVCHFALDSTFHPIIYKYQYGQKLTHSIIEMQLDRTLLLNNGVQDPTKYDLTQHIHPSLENASIIAPFFDGFTNKEMLKAIQSQVNIHHLMHCETDTKRNLYKGILNCLPSKFYRDLIMTKQDNPQCMQAIDELLNNWDNAVNNGIELVNNFIEFLFNRAQLNQKFHKDFE